MSTNIILVAMLGITFIGTIVLSPSFSNLSLYTLCSPFYFSDSFSTSGFLSVSFLSSISIMSFTKVLNQTFYIGTITEFEIYILA